MAWLDIKGKSNLTDAVGREEARERTREESAWSPRCGTDGGLTGDTYPIRRWKRKREDVRERRDFHRKEERKGRKELFGATENRINAAKTSGYSTTDRIRRLCAFEDNYRRADSISIDYRVPCTKSSSVDQSLSDILALSHRWLR